MTISAKIIQDSVSPQGKRITTFELEYPRFIHSELMTHRLFSRNSASSRAIPIEKMNSHILDNLSEPIHWGKNQAGMQAKEELAEFERQQATVLWRTAGYQAVEYSKELHKVGAHKQIANRITEPFQHMKVVLTSTEFANWFWLRDHPDAQPEIAALASEMRKEYFCSIPMEIKENEWHVPYINRSRSSSDELLYLGTNGDVLTIDVARMVSASCCAQVSYRKTDESVEKAVKIFKQLIESEPAHASPIEHQATPILPYEHYVSNVDGVGKVFEQNIPSKPETWQNGVTHIDRQSQLWSGNFKGWVQFRQTVENTSKW